MPSHATESRNAAPQASSGQTSQVPQPPQSVQSAVVELVDPRETLIPVLEGLSRALGYRRAVVALYDPARGALRGTVGLNVPEAIAESIEVSLTETDNPLVIALREGVPLRVDDAIQASRLREHTLGVLREMGRASCRERV